MKFFTPQIKSATVIFISLNILLYVFIYLFNDRIPFNYENYQFNATKFIEDSRATQGKFDLINNLAQFDAQWYLKIAEVGYPTNPHSTALEVMDGATFVFFPLYPLILKIMNIFILNIFLTAFIFSNIMLILNFLSLIYVIKKFTAEDVAIKTSYLMLFFPFSVFFRSYFTESLFLLVLLWFAYFFHNKKYFVSGFLLGLLAITRGAAVLIYPLLFIYLIKDWKYSLSNASKMFLTILASAIPIFLWIGYNYLKTGNGLYFMTVRESWNGAQSTLSQLLSNINKMINIASLEIHSFHSSKVDVILITIILILLVLSYKKINTKLWLIGLSLFISPLIFNDTMSFARYQIISFPIFLFLAQILQGKTYYFVLMSFIIGLLAVSLLFINWYWIG